MRGAAAHRVGVVDVCVCTFRRRSVVETLESVAAAEIPRGARVRVVVVDNDDTPSARDRTVAAAAGHGLDLRFVHAPGRNIAIARNAALDAAAGDWLAFVDDDERVGPGWLTALVAHARRTGADAVLGPVLPVFGAGTPRWMRSGAFHATRPVLTGGQIRSGYTGNVLLRRAAPALRGLRFREELGRSGGEDYDFFQRAHRAGAAIGYTPDAVVWEPVAPERATARWLASRRFRDGRTHAVLLRARLGGPAARMRQAGIAAAKAGYSCAAAAIHLPVPRRFAFWALRGTLHGGVAWSLLTNETRTASRSGS